MIRQLILMLLVLSSTCLIGQATFKKKYGTSGNEVPLCVDVLSDNSFLVAGGSTGGGLGGTNGMLLKFAADGTLEWTKVYGDSGYDLLTHIYPCSDGNYLVIGKSTSFGSGDLDIYVVKVDPNGNVLWERACGGTNNDGHRGVCEVSDGYILTGSATSFGAGDYDIFVEKLDFNGTSIWSTAWGTSGTNIAGEPFAVSNNEVWVSGYITIAGNSGGVLMRISANGNLIGVTRVNGAFGDWMLYLTGGWRMHHARPAPDGGYVAVGYCTGSGHDIFVIKTDVDGNNADCCIEDAPITAAVISLPTPGAQLSGVNGEPSASAAGQDHCNQQYAQIHLQPGHHADGCTILCGRHRGQQCGRKRGPERPMPRYFHCGATHLAPAAGSEPFSGQRRRVRGSLPHGYRHICQHAALRTHR
ncbi:MAG: hypothetical protein ABMA02_09560 [Saprospiraceae bacterium]